MSKKSKILKNNCLTSSLALYQRKFIEIIYSMYIDGISIDAIVVFLSHTDEFGDTDHESVNEVIDLVNEIMINKS